MSKELEVCEKKFWPKQYKLTNLPCLEKPNNNYSIIVLLLLSRQYITLFIGIRMKILKFESLD